MQGESGQRLETKGATFHAANGAVFAADVNVFDGKTPTHVIFNGEGCWSRESETPLTYREDLESERSLKSEMEAMGAGADMSELERAMLAAPPREKVLVPVR